MTLKDFLNEEWADTIKDKRGETYEIFVNPSQKEITDFVKEEIEYIRFLIELKNKKVYVWDGDLLHEDAAKELNKPYSTSGEKGYVYGEGTIERGKIFIEGLSYTKQEDINEIGVGKHPWLSKYFNGWALGKMSF
jgi:hypothetical protein